MRESVQSQLSLSTVAGLTGDGCCLKARCSTGEGGRGGGRGERAPEGGAGGAAGAAAGWGGLPARPLRAEQCRCLARAHSVCAWHMVCVGVRTVLCWQSRALKGAEQRRRQVRSCVQLRGLCISRGCSLGACHWVYISPCVCHGHGHGGRHVRLAGRPTRRRRGGSEPSSCRQSSWVCRRQPPRQRRDSGLPTSR